MTDPETREPVNVTAEEKRETPRTAAVLRVDYSTTDSFFSDFTTDINEGGMFIETDHPHASGTAVSLHFQLPGEDSIKIQGRVVWSREGESPEPPGMGIEFEDLTEDAKATINRLVRDLRTEGHR